MVNITHQIISMERGETQGSRSPLWRCRTIDGEKVNIFQHADPEKDSFHLFARAGYSEVLLAMPLGVTRTWRRQPIPVELTRNGDWWKVAAVVATSNPEPDELLMPDFKNYRRRVVHWARSARRQPNMVIWDCETTGLDDTDEIISIAVVDMAGDVKYDALVLPANLDRVNETTAIHGFTRDDLEDARELKFHLGHLGGWLLNSSWALWNAPFDMRMLEMGCLRAGVMPGFPIAHVDVMLMFARYNGDWDYERGHFKPKTLGFAAEALGIVPEALHSARSDALTTLAIIQRMAETEG